MSCEKRIERAVAGSVTLPLDRCSRYVVFGDCHRGTGNMSDNFLRNKHLFAAALEQYAANGFFYLELGDGEELWENRSKDRIKECHSDVYDVFCCLKERGRYCRIYGNHDLELKGNLPEGIILKNREGGRDLCIIHGHQADFFNSTCWRLSRFLVRYLWKPLELFGVNDPTSAARNYRKVHKYEKRMVDVAKKKDVYLLAGHSHRPHLMDGELYVNAGSCVHPQGITAIEIEHMRMSLVKWVMGNKKDGTLYVEKQVLQGEVGIV
ncbi:MAG: hypothetical protein HFI06_09570 [Eubacterium sp.]|jgi:UDP-2,3-diacylglucosamine pyrophosphatase LpxH|nr:hypothetical protein [Eubacterium sp.]